MATVDEILTRQAYADGDESWTKDDNYPSYHLYVEPGYVPVTNKRIADFNDQISVMGEQNAQFVGFQLPRYDDGLDLTVQHLYIHYQTVYGGGDGVPCNVSWSDNYVRMCWQVPAQATQEPGTIQMMIYATGTNSAGERVTWKTLPAAYAIHDGLEIGGGIPGPDTSWYEQFVAQMEGKVSTAQGYANDAQASKTAAAGSATASAQSATASAQALADNKAYVESQKAAFVGYNKRETDLKYANALIGSATDTTHVTVDDAWEAPIPGLEIAGKSEQVVTTGAQLLVYPFYNTIKTQNGITFTDMGNGTVKITGTSTARHPTFELCNNLILPPGIYSKSTTPTGIDFIVSRYIGSTYDMVEVNTNQVSFDTSAWDYDKYMYKVLLQVTEVETTLNTIVYPMINQGSTLKPWEPYTGGRPSPSPEYPQEIVSTDVTAVTVTGANLFDSTKVPTKSNSEATVTNNGDGSFTISGGGTLSVNFNSHIDYSHKESQRLFPPGVYTISCDELCVPFPYINVFITNNLFAVNCASKKVNQVTITADMVNDEGYFVSIGLYGTAGRNVVAGKVRPMLNIGTTPLPWEPYQPPQTASITLTEPLRGIGDVRDRITCRDGVWGVERAINQIDDTGTVPISEALEVLATPTWEPLPADTQAALNALTTYKGRTTTTVTAEGPEPDVTVEYVQDTRMVVADLQAQINEIRNGGTT